MEKRIDTAVLLALYGPMLTGRQLEALRLHYEDDLSLSEIAQELSVTRQAAHDAIRRGEAQLLLLEEKLQLMRKWAEMIDGLKICREALLLGDTPAALHQIEKILAEEEGDYGV